MIEFVEVHVNEGGRYVVQAEGANVEAFEAPASATMRIGARGDGNIFIFEDDSTTVASENRARIYAGKSNATAGRGWAFALGLPAGQYRYSYLDERGKPFLSGEFWMEK